MQSPFRNFSPTTYQSIPRYGTFDAVVIQPFGDEINEQIAAHGIEAYPNEACGLIVDGEYMPCENVHPEPTEHFRIDDEICKRLQNRIQAVVHSHPRFMPWPSLVDMEQQILMDVPWGIATIMPGSETPICADIVWFGDTVERLPLVGRTFRPGITDCFALARDYCKENYGVLPPDFARGEGWWVPKDGNPPANLFEDHLAESGFEIIGHDQVKAGDFFAIQYAAPVLNHCGIFLDERHVLHHLTERPSEIVSAHRWYTRAKEGGRFYRFKR